MEIITKCDSYYKRRCTYWKIRVEKFLSFRVEKPLSQLFGHAVLLECPIGHERNGCSKPKCMSDQVTTRNIAFCSFLPKQDLKLSFYMCFHQKFLKWGFCSLNVVLMPKIRCTSRNNFTHPSKGFIWSISLFHFRSSHRRCSVRKGSSGTGVFLWILQNF